MIKEALEELTRALAATKLRRRVKLAESLLMQFISSAVRQDPQTPGALPLYRVHITEDMMRNLKQWQRAKRVGFRGSAASVLKGGF